MLIKLTYQFVHNFLCLDNLLAQSGEQFLLLMVLALKIASFLAKRRQLILQSLQILTRFVVGCSCLYLHSDEQSPVALVILLECFASPREPFEIIMQLFNVLELCQSSLSCQLSLFWMGILNL